MDVLLKPVSFLTILFYITILVWILHAFLIHLKGFTGKAKDLFIYISIAIVILELSQILNVWSNSFTWEPVSFFSALIFFYTLLHFLYLIGIINRYISYTTLLPVGAFIVSICIAVPQLDPDKYQFIQLINIQFNALTLVILCYSVVISGYLTRTIGAIYKNTFKWITAGLVMSTCIFIFKCMVLLISNPVVRFNIDIVYVLSVLSGLCFVVSAYSFARIENYQQETVSKFQPGMLFSFVMIFISNRENISYLNDKIEEALKFKDTPEKKQFIFSLFLDLENYLINKEPVKRFTRDEIREMIRKRFDIDNNDGLLQRIISSKKI